MNPPKKDAKPCLPSNPTPTMRALNPHLWPDPARPAGATVALAGKTGQSSGTGMGKPRGRAPMNGTETAYSLILEAMKRRGDIVEWEREGITLRWPDGMKYTPDFTVVEESVLKGEDSYPFVTIVFIETKGPKIEEDALVKFRAARAHWSRYRFEMHQLKAGTWTQVL